MKHPSKQSLFLAYLCLGLVLAYLSPFLLGEEAAKRAAAALSAPLVAEVLYPEWNARDSSTPASLRQATAKVTEDDDRPPITLTLINDDDLKAYQATYPLLYSFHADRLDTIAAKQPAAIFIDIAFIDERPDPSINELVETICSIGLGSQTRPSIPIFLASLRYLDQPLRRELASASQSGCFTEVAVPRLTDQLDRNNWEYALQVPGATSGLDARMDSPAIAVYKALVPGEVWAKKTQKAHLGLIWGMTPHSYNVERLKDTNGGPLCRSEYRLSRDLPLIGGILNDVLGDESGQFGKPFCPFHASMPMYFLSAKPEVAYQLLKGRVVIYGADLQSLGDNAYTPLHDAIAGGYVHAMALDNLLRFGANYPRAEGFNLTRLNAGTLFTVLMVILISLVIACTATWTSDGNARRFLPGALNRWVQWSETRLMLEDTDQSSHWITRSAKVARQYCLGVWPVWCVWFSIRVVGAVVFLLLVGSVGLHMFNLGVLSWLEYAFLPMLLGTFEGGHRLAKRLDEVHQYVCIPSNK